MKKTLILEVKGCNRTPAGYEYMLSLNTFDKFSVGDKVSVTFNAGGLSRGRIVNGIQAVFGFKESDLLGKRSDAQHTYARKVYAHLRREMGVSVGDIAQELKKANASVAYYLTDNSTKVKEYCEEVRNG